MAKLPATGEQAVGEQAAPATTAGDGQAQAPVAAPAEKKLSPKHKSTRGVPDGWVTTWVPLDLPAADSETVHHAAAVREQKVPVMLAQFLKTALDTYMPSLREEAAKHVPASKSSKTAKKIAEMTPEEQAKYAQTAVQKHQSALEAAQKLLAEAKAKAEGARAESGA